MYRLAIQEIKHAAAYADLHIDWGGSPQHLIPSMKNYNSLEYTELLKVIALSRDSMTSGLEYGAEFTYFLTDDAV